MENPIPNTLEEALAILEDILPSQYKAFLKRISEDKFCSDMHHTIGRWLRNNWHLWKGGELSKWFNQYGIEHADDMSELIFKMYYRKKLGLPFKFEKAVEKCKDYWRNDELASC